MNHENDSNAVSGGIEAQKSQPMTDLKCDQSAVIGSVNLTGPVGVCVEAKSLRTRAKVK